MLLLVNSYLYYSLSFVKDGWVPCNFFVDDFAELFFRTYYKEYTHDTTTSTQQSTMVKKIVLVNIFIANLILSIFCDNHFIVFFFF